MAQSKVYDFTSPKLVGFSVRHKALNDAVLTLDRLPELVRHIRHIEGLTMRELGARLQCSQSTVGRLESGGDMTMTVARKFLVWVWERIGIYIVNMEIYMGSRNVVCPACTRTQDVLDLSMGVDEDGLFLACGCGYKGRPPGGASSVSVRVDPQANRVDMSYQRVDTGEVVHQEPVALEDDE